MAPYRLPLFEALNESLPDGIGVVALSEVEHNRPWGAWRELSFPVRVLARRPIRLGHERFLHLRTGTVAQLRAWQPKTIVIGGWDAPAYWAAAAYAKRRRIRLVLWAGSHAGTVGTSHVGALLRRRMVGLADGFLAYSSQSVDYLVSLGASRASIAVIGNAVDTEAVAAAAFRFSESPDGAALRASLTPPVIAYVGQLLPRKNVGALIDAVAMSGLPSTLLILGGGPLEGDLRLATERASVDTRFLGSLPSERVHELLGVVDCLVLPSEEEVWGLVVNEALAAGVYCIVSRKSGAFDLVADSSDAVGVAPATEEIAAALVAASKSLPYGLDQRRAVSTRAHQRAGLAPAVAEIAPMVSGSRRNAR
jgi:glycosyltransferase involved in cell wall biosynthesis